jgi:hypothetical protein
MKYELSRRLFFSWSVLMKYAVISCINLAILLVGIAIGVMLSPRIERAASASSVQQATPEQAPPPQAPAFTVDANGVKIIPAKPSLSAGTIAAFLLLSHHMQSDELVVNGLDLVKLHQEEINLLARFVSPQDIKNAVDRAKVTEQYQVNSGAAPATPASK